jgi:hypothetical protein
MPSVGATSISLSATSHRQKRRIPRSQVLMVEGSPSTGSRPRSVGQRVK